MATNIYLKIEGPDVKGESTDSKHADQIEVLGWSHSFNQPTSPVRSSAGSGTVERANHSDLTFTKYTDISSLDLLKYCWSGKHFTKMTFQQFRSAGPDKDVQFLTVELENVVISNFSVSAGGGDIPVENISLAYGKITYTYNPADEKTGEGAGNKPASADLITNVVA
jgi:type VI secretion system secreted protein Hcp